jgi:hypothetical protein
MTSMVLVDSTLESLTPSVNGPLLTQTVLLDYLLNKRPKRNKGYEPCE